VAARHLHSQAAVAKHRYHAFRKSQNSLRERSHCVWDYLLQSVGQKVSANAMHSEAAHRLDGVESAPQTLGLSCC
jgi:hypothetical protein